MDELYFNDIQNICKEILLYFDQVCKENNIKYSLAFGTLLGAVRHSDFIPWDDDVDVMMFRDDYEKLKKVFKSDKYKLLCVENEAKFTAPLCKIIDTSTILNQYSHKEKIDLGVFIDIFVYDYVPSRSEMREKEFKKLEFLQRCWNISERTAKNTSLLYKIKRIPFVIIGPRFFVKKIIKLTNALNLNDKLYVSSCLFSVYGRERDTFFYSDFVDLIDLKFGDYKFSCVKNYDYFLKQWYGDYMELPPLNKRVPHHEYNVYRKK